MSTDRKRRSAPHWWREMWLAATGEYPTARQQRLHYYNHSNQGIPAKGKHGRRLTARERRNLVRAYLRRIRLYNRQYLAWTRA